ncbi:GGDEF domain-containing phosphodiesterase [Butyrivibrio proteoclasticus]|uniref:GGDEF domain-containing phosphodiesterase n=1 Tax=Butyrivibrio proteoclasticus TaxID=43305 RepID=UPI0006841E31|nr:GGDEF domain-containing phosphodiesterase [Butyrivibrio proteoclasticus]
MSLTVEKLKDYINSMQGMYDVVRLVEPGSCHVISLDKDGNKTEGEKCYTVWGKCERCSNCTSYQASAHNRVNEKTEYKDGRECHVISLPITVEIDGKKTNMYSLELVTIGNTVRSTEDDSYRDVCADSNEDALYVSIVGNKKVSDEIISLAMLDSSIGIICLDDSGNCIYTNKQAFRMFHIPNELNRMQEFIDSWMIFDNVENGRNVWSQFYEYEGNDYLYEIHHMPAINEDTKEVIGSCIAFMDITDEAFNTGGIKFRETHDTLTGIYNLEGFIKGVRAAISLEPEDTYYLICSNINKFKLVNQLFGMEKGDEVLRSIARGLEKWCRVGDVYARIHGDEFAVFMKKSEFDEDRFRTSIHEVAKLIDNSIYRLSFQLGIYEIEDVHDSIYEMLDKARMAVDSAVPNKELSIAFYDEEMMKKTLHENEIINSFNLALENGEFHIFLQPQVDKEGTIIGGEALARWIHPEKGIIPPGMFIGVLEDANLIYKMDQYVWELAAKQLKAWQGTDKEKFSISVNISPKDLQFLDIEVVFSELVEKYGICPGKLNLEITETAIASNIANGIELIGNLREKGFVVEIDDFGSGYSSLNLLKDFAVDVLKLDMKFLDSTKDKVRTPVIIDHVIKLAQDLKMLVVAEGVETKEQLDMLAGMGCDFFQGYYFSKPVNIDSFEQLEGKITVN